MVVNSVAAPVPAIVTPELWDAVNSSRKERRVSYGRVGARRDTFSLQGRVRCAVCGGAMSAQQLWKAPHLRDYYYYYCVINHRPGIVRVVPWVVWLPLTSIDIGSRSTWSDSLLCWGMLTGAGLWRRT